MSAIRLPDPLREDLGRTFVSRQPVFDARMRLQGYRIAYASFATLGEVRPAATVRETLELFGEVFGGGGVDEIAGDSIAHLPVSGDLLCEVGVPPIRANRVVLRVRYEDAISPAVTAVLEDLAGRGYMLELDGLPGPEVELDVLKPFAVIEVDVSRWAAEETSAVLAQAAILQASTLACGVRDQPQRLAAREMGFDWFTGPFIARPSVIEDHKTPPAGLTTLVDVARLQSDETPLEDLIGVIERDPALSIELLRYVNSARFSVSRHVNSVRQAAVLIGSRSVSRWALQTAMQACAPKLTREPAIIALTRASMCERLAARRAEADADELFTIGLLSMVDTLVGMPFEEVVVGLPLSARALDALLYRTGVAGEILNAVTAYEQGVFDAPELASMLPHCPTAYRAALRWATGTLPAAL